MDEKWIVMVDLAMKWTKPLALNIGDGIGVIAPSDAIERKVVMSGVRIIQSWGLKVTLGKYIFSMVGDFAAGTPNERREDILRMIDDPKIKVIWAAHGGYAATEVLSVFNKEVVTKLRTNPKWFIGYSDVCVLLNALASFRIASIQGPLVADLADWDEMSKTWIRRMLFGETGLEIGGQANWKCLIAGNVEGRLIVSNLDSLVTTLGTRFDPLMYGADDIILGIEEWWIEKSTLQRQIDTILNHKRSKRIKAIILGRFVGVGERGYPKWGRTVTVHDLVKARVKMRGGIPMVALSDFGHPSHDNWFRKKIPQIMPPERFLALPNGIKVALTITTSGTTLRFLEPIVGQVEEAVLKGPEMSGELPSRTINPILSKLNEDGKTEAK